MKIEYISNRTFSIHDELGLQLNKAAEIILATAFIDNLAIDLLETAIVKNKSLKSLKLLIGLYGYFNKKEDLLRLRILAAKHAAKLQIQISRNPHFHWKFYYFKQKQTEIFYVGSANFTGGGLANNSELLLKINTTVKDKSGVIKTLKEFNKEWENSESISSIKLDLYSERVIAKNKNEESYKFDLLFPEEEPPQNDPTILNSSKVVLVLLTHNISAQVQKMVSNNLPKWENYFVLNKKKHFQNCLNYKKLLIIERESGGNYKRFWAVLKDSADHLKTADGDYFIEYEIQGRSKKLTLMQIQKLKGSEYRIDIKARKNVFIQRVLGSRQTEKIKEFLK